MYFFNLIICFSKIALINIFKEKDKQQYQTYLSNVNTLNCMKDTFKELFSTILTNDQEKREFASQIKSSAASNFQTKDF
jgi:hypothetical protein